MTDTTTIQSPSDVADIAEMLSAAMASLPRRTDLLSGRPETELEARARALSQALGQAYQAAVALANSGEWHKETP